MKLWAHGSWPNLADGSLNLSVEPFPQVCVCVRVYFCLCNSSETKPPQSVLLTIQVFIGIGTGSWEPDTGEGYWCWFSFFSPGPPLPLWPPLWSASPCRGSLPLLFIWNFETYSQPVTRLMYSVKEMSSWTFVVASAIVRVFSGCESNAVEQQQSPSQIIPS